jgi:hypothetical protein
MFYRFSRFHAVIAGFPIECYISFLFLIILCDNQFLPSRAVIADFTYLVSDAIHGDGVKNTVKGTDKTFTHISKNLQ